MVYRGRRKEALIYTGPPEGIAIYLYLSGSHYNVITNPSAFLCASQLCEDCHETYNDPLTHISVVVNGGVPKQKKKCTQTTPEKKRKTVQSTSSLILNVLGTLVFTNPILCMHRGNVNRVWIRTIHFVSVAVLHMRVRKYDEKHSNCISVMAW